MPLMERAVQRGAANGHAVAPGEECTEDARCELLARDSTSNVQGFYAKEDVKEFVDEAKETAYVESEESGELDEEVNWNCAEYRAPMETFNELDSPSVNTMWKLDRRASGHLFWRRDSSTLKDGVDPTSRVKFRFDVTVREYAEQQQESEQEDPAEEQVVDDSGGVVLRKRKSSPVTKTKDVKSPKVVAMSPVVIYSAVLLAVLMAAAIHWYLWGRAAWANLTGGRRESSV